MKFDTMARLLCGVFAFLSAVIVLPARAGETLEVPLGETATFGETTNFTAVTVHGSLNVTAGDFAVTNYNAGGSRVATYVDLGPDAGDLGEMVVSNATLREYGNSTYMTVRIGNNGGGDRAKLRLYNTTYAYSYLKELLLSASAATDGDRFEAMEIGAGGDFLCNDVKNSNAKPLVISFTGSPSPGLRRFWNGDFFLMPGGDIILKSVDGNDIMLARQGNTTVTVNFFNASASNRNGMLKTEGSGDFVLNVQGGNLNPMFCINYANVAWGHSGDFCIGSMAAYGWGGLQVSADNVLPYGSGTGGVVLRSSHDNYTNFLDLYGTSQRVNSLETRRFCYVTNTSPTEAVLVFGTGGTDGSIKNVCLTNSAIRCEKTGSGTLTLDGAALNALSAGSGTIHIASKSYVDTLAITNVALTFADGDSSLLEVREWRIDPSVPIPMPDGAATNSVFGFPAVPGASAATKDGANFVTYMTPADAHGIALNVNGGVLRFGGAACTNEFWRLILKKANGNGKTFTRKNTGETQFITVGLGSLGMFNGEGISAIGGATTYNKDDTHDPADAYLLSRGQVMSKNPVVESTAADNILGGGFSTRYVDTLIGTTNTFSNLYDYPCQNAAEAYGVIKNFSWSVIYDGSSCGGKALDPEDESTWEIVTWRMKTEWPKHPTSYAMRKAVNWDHNDPHLTDWALQSSPDGRAGTWVTMDERTDQRWWGRADAGTTGMNEYFQFTYNNHIPYLFNSLNADWRFTTFGPVSVAAGATLDLSNLRPENIAFNGLKVDMAAGAGTITHFAPAANGRLYVENATAEQQSAKRLTLPLNVGTWLSSDNLSTWTVCVNGVADRSLAVESDGVHFVVRRVSGLMLIVR